MIDFFGRGGALKPSWYGDCLPSRDFPMLIDLYLQGRLDLDRFVQRDHRPRRGRGGVPPHGARRGAPLGRRHRRSGVGLMAAAGRPGRHQRHLLARRRGLRRRQQHLARRRRRRGARGRRRPRPRARSSTGVAGRTVVAIVCTHGHNDHINVAVELADAVGRADLAAPRRHHAVGGREPRPARSTARSPTASVIAVGGVDARRCCTRRATARAAAASTTPTADVLFSGDTLFNGGPGATGRSFSSIDHDPATASATACCRCPTTPWSTPATATTPPSAPRRPACWPSCPGTPARA